jgi:hypothetical protein
MANRPSQSGLKTAQQLAHLIITKSKDKEMINKLVQKLRLISVPGNANYFPQADTNETAVNNKRQDGSLGIWTPVIKDGQKYYIRDSKYLDQFDHWAAIHEIPPKGSKKRVVYLGESAARGFLLDPFYTPAQVLETLLNSKPGLLEAEVVDLARTSCTIQMLTELFSACMVLNPDALVVFAGNNWWYGLDIPWESWNEIIGIVEGNGKFQDVKAILDSQVKKLVIGIMEQLDNVSKTYHVPVVFIIPEFNLVDYRLTPEHRLMSWLQTETDKWLELKNKGKESLDRGDIDGALSLAREMIKLNPGSPFGFELLGKCKLEQGLFGEAGEYLRTALDMAIYSGLNVPCCGSVIGQTILEEAVRYDISVIDLPGIFKTSQSGMPPGRELFLDYCHLSAKGIRIAMASTAQSLFAMLAKAEIPAGELRRNVPEPDEDVCSRAHFFAAVHNAHRGNQPFDILYYHCLEALNLSPAVRELMECFVEMATYHSPWHLNKSNEKLFAGRKHRQFPYLYQERGQYFMDMDLVDAIISALKVHGINIEEKVLELRKNEHGTANGKIDLLESYYHLTSYDVPFIDSPIGYYRAYTLQSRFFPVLEKDKHMRLKLVYRVPPTVQHNQKVLIKINDRFEQELPPSTQWKKVSLYVSGNLLKDGVNEIMLQWPSSVKLTGKSKPNPGVDKSVLINEIAYPVCGEVHMFTVEEEDSYQHKN